MRSPRLRPAHLGLVAALALPLPASVHAQWVLLARHAIGRVEQMSQQSTQADGPSYDSAAVMLEAPPDKVYAAVLSGLAKAQGLTITRQDAATRLVQFSNGPQIAGIKIAAIGDNLTHMMISSAHTGTQPAASQLIMASVLRVCAEMKVECSPSDP